MFPRTLEGAIERAMKTFPAVLVTGPRQSGKTTLLFARFSKSHQFVSLENPDVRARVLEDPVGFLKNNPAPLILDEIQYIPELLHYIKSAIDSDRKPGQWLLSGSQSFSLMQGVSQSLSGRIAVLTLLPFSIGESQKRAGKPSPRGHKNSRVPSRTGHGSGPTPKPRASTGERRPRLDPPRRAGRNRLSSPRPASPAWTGRPRQSAR